MKRTAIATVVALGLTLLAFSAPAFADTIDDPNDVAWASIRGYTSQQFHDYFNQKKD